MNIFSTIFVFQKFTEIKAIVSLFYLPTYDTDYKEIYFVIIRQYSTRLSMKEYPKDDCIPGI